MSALARLARALEQAARDQGRIESGFSGMEPELSPLNGASADHGVEPYLLSFRIKLPDPRLSGGGRTYTVTVIEEPS